MCPLRVALAAQTQCVTGAELMKSIVPMLGRISSVLIVLPLLPMMPNMFVGILVRASSLVTNSGVDGLCLDGPRTK